MRFVSRARHAASVEDNQDAHGATVTAYSGGVRATHWLVAVAGCGRLGFGDTRSDAGLDGDGVAIVTRCTGTTSLICDGFEDVASSPWTVITSAGGATLDSTRAHLGTSSMHVHINSITGATVNPHALLHSSQGLAGGAITGMVYARVWIYIASPHATTEFDQLVNFADVPGSGISVGTRNGVLANNDYTDGQYAESTTAILPVDRWTCLQFEMPSGIAGTTRVAVDDNAITDITLSKSTVQPAPDHVYIGLEWVGTVSSLPAIDAWLDEIIVDSKPTTCAQ